MATLTVKINSPQPNELVGDNFLVGGGVTFQGGTGETFNRLNSVTVQFGPSGSTKPATVNGLGWQCTGTVPSTVPPGSSVLITVKAAGLYTPKPNPSGEQQDVAGTATVNVILCPAPVLTIEPFPLDVTSPALPFKLHLKGTATAALGLASVQYSLGGSPPPMSTTTRRAIG